MTATRFGDALRLLAYREYFADFELALAMAGFTIVPEAGEGPADRAAQAPAPSDEDERVYGEPTDGWVPSRDETWPSSAGDGASDQASDGAGARADGAPGAPPPSDLAIEEIEIYGDDWEPIERPQRDKDQGLEGVRPLPRGSEPRPTSRFVIAHVLLPSASEQRPSTPFRYRSVPGRKRGRPWGTSERSGRLDDGIWRLAVECLSATTLKSSRQSIDILACVKALARHEAIQRLPMRERRMRRAEADTVLCDVSLANGPLWDDVTAFVASIQANSRHEVDVLGFYQTVEAIGCGKGPIWTWSALDVSRLGQRVIAVSHVPADASLRREAWRRLAESLTASGRYFALVNVAEQTAGAGGDWPGLWFDLVR